MDIANATNQVYYSPQDEKVVDEVQRQCDKINWKLGRKDDKSTCYWSDELDPSPVIGFKRVSFVENASLEEMASYHGEGIIDVWAYLSKDTYASGEHLKVLHHSKNIYHSVVRTLFDLPLGMAGREYLHHLYKKRVDKRTYVISYRTPEDVSEFPPAKEGFIRCQIYNSGDRFTLCEDGRIRVEHLMTYTFEGSITPWMADNLFCKAHINAYFKEGKSVKEIFDNTAPGFPGGYPSQFSMYVNMDRMNPEKLMQGMLQALDDKKVKWSSIHNQDGVSVSTGFIPYCPLTAFRTDVELNVGIDRLVNFLSKDLIANLDKWDSDFVEGETVKVFEDSADRKSWLIRTAHKAHWPLKNREYTFYLMRETQADGSIVLAFQSVLSYDIPIAKGAARGNLYPGAYRITPLTDNRVKLERIVIKEYNGKVLREKQNKPSFTKKLANTIITNTKNLKQLFN